MIERLVDDPWLRAKGARFSIGLRELHRSGTLDTYVAALAAFHSVGSFEKAGVERVATFLARTIPWLPAVELRKAAPLFRDHSLPNDAARRVFDAALASLEPWTPDPAQRPLPPVPPSEGFDETAWLAKCRRNFGYARGKPVLDALGIALIDLQASLPGARPPITAALVIRFFEAVLGEVPRVDWLRAIAPLVEGYAGTVVGPLVRELVDELSRRG